MGSAPPRMLIYADGSCEGNPGPGGWGVVIDGHPMRELSGGQPDTTNNRMELTAAIEALRATEPGACVTVRSDSEYLVKTMNLGWRRAKNQDLWKELDAEVAKRDVGFEWVRGHAGDPLNERADRLAREAASVAAHVRRDAGRPSLVRARPARSLRRAAVADDAAVAEQLKPALGSGERIARCAACGRDFVALADERHCSLARCQLGARGAGRRD